MQVPHAEAAVVSRDKVVDYLLNPRHPDGAGKAAFFAGVGYHVDRWEELAKALTGLIGRCPITVSVASRHGSKYIVDGEIDTPNGRTVSVRTVWIVDHDNQAPRLVTAYPREQES